MLLTCTKGKLEWRIKRMHEAPNELIVGQIMSGDGGDAIAVNFSIPYNDSQSEEFILVYARGGSIEWWNQSVNGMVFHRTEDGRWSPENSVEVLVGEKMVVASIRGDLHPSFCVTIEDGMPTNVMRAELGTWKNLPVNLSCGV